MILSQRHERPFLVTAALAGVISAVAWVFGEGLWAARFASSAVMVTMTWFCSAVVIFAMTQPGAGKALPVMVFLPIKAFSLLGLILCLRTLGLELSSFLTAMNLYFVAAIGCFAVDSAARRIRESGQLDLLPADSALAEPTRTHV